MGKIAVLCVLFSIWFTAQKYLTRKEEPYVTTQLMRIKGRWEISYSGRSYKAFEGIPYALPPTDERRFEVRIILIIDEILLTVLCISKFSLHSR